MNFDFDYRPSDSPHVATVWRTHSERAGSFISHAASQWEMVLSRHEGKTVFTVRGPETLASPAPCPADTEFFGIVFKLGSFMPCLPVATLVDNQVDLPQASSTSFWLHGERWQLPDFENADTFVQRLVRAGLLLRDPVVIDALQGERQHLSTRALQYRFVRATGLSHAAICGIERARKAVDMLEQGASITHTALEAGYADHSHLTRSLKRLAGRTPAQIARAQAA